MKTIVMLFSVFSSGSYLFADSSVLGGYAKYYEVTGCTFPYNLIREENMGYAISGSNFDWDREDLIICDKNKYIVENPSSKNWHSNAFKLSEKIFGKTQRANCFQTTINHSEKTIVFTLLPANRKVTMITETGKERILNVCLLEPSVVEESWYAEIILNGEL